MSRPVLNPRVVAGVLLLATLLRVAALWHWSAELTTERDAYLGIAAGLREGRGFSSPGTTEPTAFRPPLYPLVLAASPLPQIGTWVAIVNLFAGVGTVWLTLRLGSQLGLPPEGAIVAGLLIACDPLLLSYTAQPMTESLCTLLTTATLLAWTRLKMPDLDAGNLVRAQELASSAGTAARCAVAGVLFGLCVLCRPTAWVWGGLGLMWLVWGQRRPHQAQHVGIGDRGGARVFALVAGIAVVVAPWVIRNTVVFGRPILTTTHGGYTLLLGNNPEFYAEVVHQPWGTTWDGSHGGGQAAWAKRLQARLDAEGVRGELATDRSLSAEARRHIIAQPLSFLQACLLRLARFWNGVPQGSAAAGLPGKVLIVLGLWYAAEYLLAFRGLWKVIQGREAQWTLAVLLVLAFTAVHLIYWSNVRMRAPVMPVVTLLAAHGLKPRARQLL